MSWIFGTHKSTRCCTLRPYDVQVSARAPLSSEKRSDIWDHFVCVDMGVDLRFLGFILTRWGMQFFIFFQCFSSFLHLQWFGVIIVIPCLSYGLLPQFLIEFPCASVEHCKAQLSIFAQVDDVGNAWVAGYTESSLDGHTNAGSDDIFLMKFDAQGVHLWTRQRGGESSDYAHALQAVRRGAISFSNLFHGGKTWKSFRFRFSCKVHVPSQVEWHHSVRININLCAFEKGDTFCFENWKKMKVKWVEIILRKVVSNSGGLLMGKMSQGSVAWKRKFETQNTDLHSGWFYWIEVIGETKQKKIERQAFK